MPGWLSETIDGASKRTGGVTAALLLACAGIALGQCRVVLGAELARAHPLSTEILIAMVLLHGAGVVFAAWFLPRLHARGRRGRAAAYCCLAAFGLTQFAGIGWWLTPGWLRVFMPSCGGGLIGGAIWLFFTRVPRNRQPVFLSGSIALGMIVKVAVSAWAAAGDDAPGRFVVFSAISAAVMALVLIGGLMVKLGAPEAGFGRDDSLNGAGNGSGIGWAVGALAVFCVMNGAVLGGLIPLPVVMGLLDSGWTVCILLLAPLCAGALLRRDFAAGYMRIVTAGSVLFLCAVTLSAAKGSDGFFLFIHTLAGAGQALVYPSMMLALGRLARGELRTPVMAALPYLAAIATGFWANSRKEHLIGDASLTVLVSLFLCVLFLVFARRAKFGPEEADGSGLGRGGGADRDVVMRLGALCRERDLSPREREIALFLFDGQSNDDIAASMHIARTTVETHVQSILKKLGVANRREIKKLL